MMRSKKKFRKSISIFIATLLMCNTGAVFAQESTEDPDVVLAYKTHFDIGFTDFAENVVHEYRTRFIDKALDAVDASSHLPKEQQFKWTLPGWPLKKILEDWPGQTAERKKRIDQAMKDERILVHALPYSMETEAVDLEAMVRSLSFSSAISREYGRPLPRAAKMTDVPSHSWVLPTILKNAGVDFLHLGCNPASTPPDVPPLFWWEGPDGSRVLTMYSKDYGAGVLPPGNWPYDAWLGLKMTGDNAGPPSISEVLSDIKQVTNAGKTYKIGALEDFSDMILNGDTSQIPVVRGDMPDTWIHGLTSAPNETRISRNLRPQVYELDSLATMLNLWGIEGSNMTNLVNSSYEDLLRYGEHTWGFNEHIENYEADFYKELEAGNYNTIQASWDEKGRLVDNVDKTLTPALDVNSKLLAQAVKSDEKRIVVFNALPWERDGLVELVVEGEAPASLQNKVTGEVIPVSYADGKVSFIAKSVPSMGYATFVYSDETVQVSDLSIQGNVLENQFYKVTIDAENGSISSIIDKTSDRELVSQEDTKYGFSQYFNERFSNEEVLAYNKAYNTQHGGWAYDDMSKTGLNTDKYRNVPHQDSFAKNIAVSYETTDNSVSAIITAGENENRFKGMQLVITLYSEENYIDIDWSMDGKVKDPWPMADWLSFPFLVENPDYQLYRLGGVMDPSTDIVKNTQVNNLALDGGMTITSPDGSGVGLISKDSPLVSIGKPGIWKFDKGEKAFNPESPTVFINLFNNQWDTNYPTWNGGDWSSNVRIWAINDYDSESSLVTPSRETRLPMTAAYADNRDGNLPTQKSSLQISEKGIQVTSFGPNVDGEGTVLRLWEQTGRDVSCTVILPSEFKATSVQPVDLRGQKLGYPIPVRNNKFTVNIGRNTPYSVIIDYDIDATLVPAVSNVAITDIPEQVGAFKVTWEEDKRFLAGQVEVTATDPDGNAQTTLVDAGEKTVILDRLKTGTLYTVSLTAIDIGKNRSKTVSTKHMTSGSTLISVKSAKASNTFAAANDIMNVVNNSGMTGFNPETAKHDNNKDAYTMWHTNTLRDQDKPVWVEFDFGAPESIDRLYIWNINQMNYTNRGLKNIKIEYSLNRTDWIMLDKPANLKYVDGEADLDYPFRLAQASGQNGITSTNLYTSDKAPIDFGGVEAQYVRISAKDSWGSPSYWGLSELMFMGKGKVIVNELKAAIAAAQLKVDQAVVGNQPGQYPQAAVDALKTAITAAQSVVVTATKQAEVTAAIEALQVAVQAFDKAGAASSSGSITAPATVTAGKTFNVQVGLSSVTQGVYAQDLSVDFDPATLEFLTASSLIPGVSIIDKKTTPDGKLRFIVVSEGPGNAVTGTKNVLELTFKAKEVAGAAVNSVISMTKAMISDAEGAEITIKNASSTVQVVKEQPPVATGDLNGDSKVTIGDLAIAAANYGATKDSPNWSKLQMADFDKNGVIDISDLAAIAQKIIQ